LKLVKQRTTDKHPIRKSAKDSRNTQTAPGTGGIDRVAGLFLLPPSFPPSLQAPWP